jgi:hypothetical protein
VVEVQDGASGRTPLPAVGRDPARGGLGLHLIARLADDHGWWPDGDTESVRATIPGR